MENKDLYAKIAARTGGNIYLGVVGPVRTGKSTLVKRIMEMLVIPNITDPYRAERAKDELPQSGSGITIMTSEPKFVPEEAVEISPDGTTKLHVRMIDSVGYVVEGAGGVQENGAERMVTTPWFDYEIPLSQAAEIGTKKVMEEHCSIGLIVTTDGTVSDLPRSSYAAAERRAIQDMAATGKPFLVLINSRQPQGELAGKLKKELDSEFSLHSVIADCAAMDEQTLNRILSGLLETFPIAEIQIHLPHWLDALKEDHCIKQNLYRSLLEKASRIKSLGDAKSILKETETMDEVSRFTLDSADPGTGTVCCSILLPDHLFYEILSAKASCPIESEKDLLDTLSVLSQAKKSYDKVASALESARSTGYGIVMPSTEEMTLESPEVIKKGGNYGVRLKAGASSIHMIRVDIDTEISPMVGGEQQSKEMIGFLSDENPDSLWESNIFGKSVHTMIQEGLTSKLIRTPAEVQEKFRNSLTRIVNDGAAGLICIII